MPIVIEIFDIPARPMKRDIFMFCRRAMGTSADFALSPDEIGLENGPAAVMARAFHLVVPPGNGCGPPEHPVDPGQIDAFSFGHHNTPIGSSAGT